MQVRMHTHVYSDIHIYLLRHITKDIAHNVGPTWV